MIRLVQRLGLTAVLGILPAPALAWQPPAVGIACKGARGGGSMLTAVAGNYLGGRPLRDGIVDRKSFQACFRSEAQCAAWLAGKAASYPLGPGIATCAQVVLR